jgi:hypothetical protein
MRIDFDGNRDSPDRGSPRELSPRELQMQAFVTFEAIT